MLEGKFEKLEFQEMLSSPRKKIKVSKSKTKMLKKEPREMENQRKKMMKKEEEMKKGQRKMIFHVMIKMILNLITLKHN